jgi:YVTN family beta-propeller protein
MNRKISQHLFIGGIVWFLMVTGVSSLFGAPFAYIPSQDADSVFVVDQQTNKIVTAIPVGDSPHGVAVSPSGTRVYVTNYLSHTVSVINGTTQAVIGSPISVGDYPIGIVVSPSGSIVYVANEGSETISVIDAVTNTVIDTITDVPCASLAIDPSGGRLYVGSYFSNEIRVIDTATRTVVGATLTLPTNITNIVLNPTASYLYVANLTNSVYVVRTADLAITQVPVDTSTWGIAVHPSGSFVYAVGDNVVVIDAGANTVFKDVNLGAAAYAVSFNTDGTRAFVSQAGTTNVNVIDTETHAAIDTIVAGDTFVSINGSFVAPHRHVWSGTTSFPIKLTSLGDNGKFAKGNETITGKVVEMRTLGNKYSLLFLSDDLKSSIFLPDVTFLMTDVDGSKSEKALLGGTGKYYFHDGSMMISGIAHFDGSATLKKDGPGGNFISATLKGTVAGGKLQEQYFTGKVRGKLDAVQ